MLFFSNLRCKSCEPRYVSFLSLSNARSDILDCSRPSSSIESVRSSKTTLATSIPLPMSTTGVLTSKKSQTKPKMFETRKVCFLSGEPLSSPTESLSVAVRKAAKWYQDHLEGQAEIIFLTNSQAKKTVALSEGVSCCQTRTSTTVSRAPLTSYFWY